MPTKLQLHLAKVFLKIFLRDRQSIFFSLFFPIIFMTVFAFANNGEVDPVKLGIVNNSASEVAADFSQMLNANLLFDVTSDEILDSPEVDGGWIEQAAGNAVFGSPRDVKEGVLTVASVIASPFVPLHEGAFPAHLELDARDLDLLAAEMQSPSPDNRFDLNADDVVDFEDRRLWVEDEDFKHTYFGDSNLDGSVDSVDLNNLALNWQSSETTWAMGDFTGDGNTNAADLNLLALSWQSGQQAASVPEPTSALLLAIGLVMGVTHLKYGRAKESHREQQD